MIIKLILFLVIFLNILLGLFVLTQNSKSPSNRLFSLMSFFAAIWTFSNYMANISSYAIWLEGAYAFGALVMLIGLIWISIITESRFNNRALIFIILTGALLFTSSFFEGFIIESNSAVVSGAMFHGDYRMGLTLHTIYYLFISILMLKKLYCGFRKINNHDTRLQLKYVLIGTSITLIISGLSSFILPHFSIFIFGGSDSIGFLIFLLLISYSIVKHHLFNIKLVTVELITFTLWIIIFLRILFAKDLHEVLVESFILLVSIVLGILLIRTSISEARQKEQLNDLNLNLARKVAEQTEEIKKAYDLEKKARRDLEKLNETKDQFIMITQHNIRTPVTSISREIESVKLSIGEKVNPAIKRSLENTTEHIDNLKRMVDDFLNITTLKAGSNILNISNGNIKPLLENVLNDLKIDIENMNIYIDYPESAENWPDMKIDTNKIREVIMIVIENAVKYNTINGNITIKTATQETTLKIIVENTGVGIAKEEKLNIFERLFYRTKTAQSANPRGMGIGLSVSLAIVRAHHGELSIYSDGENKGARVEITLPFDFIKDLNDELSKISQ